MGGVCRVSCIQYAACFFDDTKHCESLNAAVHCLYVLLNMFYNQITIIQPCAQANTDARESLFSHSRCL